MAELPHTPWTRSPQDLLDQLQVDPQTGLIPLEVEQRQQTYGPNRLEAAKRRGAAEIFIDQFKSPVIGLLAVAAIAAFAFQEWIEGIAVILAILINTLIGFVTEVRAVRSMEALNRLSSDTARVRRNGHIQEIPAVEVVPGDIAVLDSGDIIDADLRLIAASNLQANESALTGESLPVEKSLEPLPLDTPLAERQNLLFSGTAVTRGTGEAIVVATGMQTELGRIAALASAADSGQTPLEKRLDKLSRQLIWVTLAIVILVFVAGVVSGKDWFLMVETAIALAVAAIPEGLPIVATVALARGLWRMARRHALINDLSAVETLGATSVICTDKTGTLTENRMTVTQILLADGLVEVTGEGLEPQGKFLLDAQPLTPRQSPALQTLLEVSVLCNNAALQPEASNESRVVGDPMEVALLIAGAKAGLQRPTLLQSQPELREEAFDPDTKMMATVHQLPEGDRVAVKGAPESVLKACTQVLTPTGIQPLDSQQHQTWCDRIDRMAAQGLRTLALASKTAPTADTDPYHDLTLLGVVGLVDPPRQDVKPAIAECRAAGIRVVMVTGDQPITARNIALAVGLADDPETEVILGQDIKPPAELTQEQRHRIITSSVLARVSPEQKLNLIQLHQRHQAIVAMTGDGVNDAPALRQADIGIAMGQRGTEVAREAAEMVLQDDAFPSIVAAIEQGRAIFNNIRKFTLYLLSGNVGQIIAVTLTALINAPLPLLPLQILYLNIVNDAFPALALGVGEAEPGLMRRPPRPSREAILGRRHWLAIAGYGIVIAIVLLAGFGLALLWLELNLAQATTVSFLTLALSRLWHVFNMRDRDSGLIHNEISRNPFIWGAFGICIALLLAAVYFPPLALVLGTGRLPLSAWLLVIGLSLVPLIVGQVVKLYASQRSPRHSGPRRA